MYYITTVDTFMDETLKRCYDANVIFKQKEYARVHYNEEPSDDEIDPREAFKKHEIMKIKAERRKKMKIKAEQVENINAGIDQDSSNDKEDADNDEAQGDV